MKAARFVIVMCIIASSGCAHVPPQKTPADAQQEAPAIPYEFGYVGNQGEQFTVFLQELEHRLRQAPANQRRSSNGRKTTTRWSSRMTTTLSSDTTGHPLVPSKDLHRSGLHQRNRLLCHRSVLLRNRSIRLDRHRDSA